MPIKKSAFKALRQAKNRAAQKQKIKSDLTALIRRVRKAIEKKDKAKASDWLLQSIKKIDKAVQQGVLKKNTAARTKSRLHQAVKALIKN